MKKHFTHLTFLLLLLPSREILAQQCSTTTCNVPTPAFEAWNACILPSPDALDCYYGQMTNSTQWFAFVADSISAFFEISVYECSSGNDDGVVGSIWGTTDCHIFEPKGISTIIQTGTTGIVAAVWTLVPGQIYYLMISPYGDAFCDYSINGAPYIAGGLTQGICLPTAQLSEFFSFSTANWSLNPPGAGIISGDNPSANVFVEWLQLGNHEICVTSVECPDSPKNCVDVIVEAETFDTFNVAFCEGEWVQCGTQTYLQPGNYYEKINLDYFGCDSNLWCFVELIETEYSEEQVWLCEGKSVDCAGQTFTAAGEYEVNLTSSRGCDSIVTCRVFFSPTVEPPVFQEEVCAGGSIQICGTEYNVSGLHEETCINWLGCDSIVRVDLAVLDPQPIIAQPAILPCLPGAVVDLDGTGALNFNFETILHWTGPGIVGATNLPIAFANQPGTYCLEVTQQRNGTSCTETGCVEVTKNTDPPEAPTIAGNPTVCDGDFESYVAQPYGNVQATGYAWTMPNGEIFFVESLTSISVDWTGSAGGQLCVRAFNPCGSSPTWCIPITVLPAVAAPQIAGSAVVCKNGGAQTYSVANPQTGVTYLWSVSSGASFTGGGTSISANFSSLPPGAAQVCVTATSNCGSNQTCFNVQVAAPPTASLSGSTGICAGDSAILVFNLNGSPPFNVTYSDGSQNLTLSGILNGHQLPVNPSQTTTYSLISAGDNSCAQAASGSATVTVWQAASVSRMTAICEGEGIWLGGGLQASPGIYLDHYLTWHGCDSLVTTTLTVHERDSLFLFETSCNPANAGVFVQNFDNQNGCDSVVTTTISFAESETTLLFGTTCDPAAAGVFSQNLVTAEGCDNLVISTVSLQPGSFSQLFQTTCDPAAAGVSVQVFPNQFGCDSTVTTTVTLAPLDTTFLFGASCDPSLAGIFTQNLSSASGCDSVVISTVTLLPSDTTLQFGTSCNPGSTGVFVQNLTNLSGCDSTVILTVSYSLSDTTLLAVTTCDPSAAGVFSQNLLTWEGCDSLLITTVSLQPSDTTLQFGTSCNPGSTGVFTQNLTNLSGCDSTVILTINYALSDTTLLAATTCDPGAAGVFSQNLLTWEGCDSLVISTVTLLPSDEIFLASTTCDPSAAGVFVQNLSNQNGCDSAVIETVSLLQSDQIFLSSTTCDPSAAGIFIQNLTNQNGCDSIITETVSLLPNDTILLAATTCDPAQAGVSSSLFSNQFGCDSLVILTTSLLPPDACGVSATLLGSTILCDQTTGSLTLTATLGQPPFSYEALLGGNLVAAGSIVSAGLPEIIGGLPAGNYVVNLTSTGGFTAILQACIGQLLPPSLAVVGTSDFNGFEVSCTGGSDGSALATASGGVAPFTFSWSNGQASAEISGMPAGNYTVTVTGANGCTDAGSVTLDEPEPLHITFIVNNLKCFEENSGAILVQVEGGAAPFRFSLDRVNFQASDKFTGLSAGAYEITALDANDCETVEIILVNAPVAVDVDLGADLTILAGDGITLNALVNVPFDSLASVVWSGLDSTECPGCLLQPVAPLVTTTFAVSILGKNGCSDSDETTVFVDNRKHVFVPNAFSPNDDGVNDLLQIFAKPGAVKNIRSFRIFNRWGAVVWQQFNVQPDDPAFGWDGNFQCKAADPAVFVWFAEIEFVDGEVKIFKGDVTLMR
ncbi:MAG: gliding motility-associated C-terminal domain-containing protein [Bacteroidota bacterium]